MSADYSGFAKGPITFWFGDDSPPCAGCGRVRQEITDSRGTTVSVSLGKAADGRWWCNGCFAAAGRPV